MKRRVEDDGWRGLYEALERMMFEGWEMSGLE